MTIQRVTQRLPFLSALDYRDAVADGADYAPAVNRAVTALAALGNRGEIVLPNRAEAYRTMITLPSYVTLRGGGSSSEFIHDTASLTARLIKAEGTVGAKTALTVNALTGAGTITLPTGAGASWVAGDYIELESTTIVYAPSGRTRDIRKVTSVAGDVLTIEGLLIHDVLTSAAATFAKVTMVQGVTVRDFTFRSTNAYNNAHTLLLRRCVDARVLDVSLFEMGGGILLYDVYGGVVRGVTIDTLPNGWLINPTYTGYGYGITLGGACSGVVIDGLRSRHVRHAVTTVADERTGPTSWGGPRDCIIANSVSEQAVGSFAGGGTSHFDTHEFGANLTFANCIAAGGGEAGFQVRSKATRLIGCAAFRCGGRGVSITTNSSGCLIDGGEFAFNKGPSGIAASGPNSRVVGAWVHDNDAAGIVVGGTDVTVESCRIEDNGVLGVSPYGIQEGVATRPRYLNNIIPQRASRQAYAILGLGTTAVAVGNVCLGYGTTNPFYNVTSGAKLVNTTTDTMGVKSLTGTYTAIGEDAVLLGNASPAAFTVTLPAAADHKGRRLTIKKVDASANAVTVDGNAAETIDGATTKALATQWATISIISDGANWVTIS